MDRKPKVRRMASKDPVRDDPEQSERFLKAAQTAIQDTSEIQFNKTAERILRVKQSSKPAS